MDHYSNVRKHIKTGDLVLFSGKTGYSEIVRLFTNSKWSHVGIALTVDSLDMLLLWESTVLTNVNDAVDQLPKRGVMLVPMSERISTHDGEIVLRQLSCPVTDQMLAELTKLRTEINNRPYETGYSELLKSAVDKCRGFVNHADLSSVFCSELVAESLQRMGILNDAMSANEYVPKDFAVGGCMDTFLSGYSYGPEIKLK